jgi:hypothetical protein
VSEPAPALAPFDRRFPDPGQSQSRIGGGGLGGKAQGLILADHVLESRRAELAGGALDVDVPALVVLGTEVYDAFLERNGLRGLLGEDPTDERVRDLYQRAAVPAEAVGDLRALATQATFPLAVRSSSNLEDALGRPFAGVYGTKMISGAQPVAEARFKSLVEAVKFVYASASLRGARDYMRAVGVRHEDEKMAVVIQEVVGARHGDRFYPDVSGVARSYDFYPQGRARPQDGVGLLAAGLGKTIVDGGVCWTFSPAWPRVAPPFATPRDLLRGTQTQLWAVHVGSPPAWDPMAETEYLVRAGLAEAEADGTLRWSASTYDAQADRVTPGLGRAGPRVLDFAPLLVHDELPLAALLRELLPLCEAAVGAPVEIEFALACGPGRRARFGLLQVRPLLLATDEVAVEEEELRAPGVVIASRTALGNGTATLSDVVYIEPRDYEARHNPAIASELEALNRRLLEAGREYVLIGFGRWGSSDPWLGVPVRWDQISGARAIVEAGLPQFSTEPSQGSHFFHNLSSAGVLYLTVPAGAQPGVDWSWLAAQEPVAESPRVRHVRCRPPLVVRVDGRTGRGMARVAEVA